MPPPDRKSLADAGRRKLEEFRRSRATAAAKPPGSGTAGLGSLDAGGSKALEPTLTTSTPAPPAFPAHVPYPASQSNSSSSPTQWSSGAGRSTFAQGLMPAQPLAAHAPSRQIAAPWEGPPPPRSALDAPPVAPNALPWEVQQGIGTSGAVVMPALPAPQPWAPEHPATAAAPPPPPPPTTTWTVAARNPFADSPARPQSSTRGAAGRAAGSNPELTTELSWMAGGGQADTSSQSMPQLHVIANGLNAGGGTGPAPAPFPANGHGTHAPSAGGQQDHRPAPWEESALVSGAPPLPQPPTQALVSPQPLSGPPTTNQVTDAGPPPASSWWQRSQPAQQPGWAAGPYQPIATHSTQPPQHHVPTWLPQVPQQPVITAAVAAPWEAVAPTSPQGPPAGAARQADAPHAAAPPPQQPTDAAAAPAGASGTAWDPGQRGDGSGAARSSLEGNGLQPTAPAARGEDSPKASPHQPSAAGEDALPPPPLPIITGHTSSYLNPSAAGAGARAWQPAHARTAPASVQPPAALPSWLPRPGMPPPVAEPEAQRSPKGAEMAAQSGGAATPAAVSSLADALASFAASDGESDGAGSPGRGRVAPPAPAVIQGGGGSAGKPNRPSRFSWLFGTPKPAAPQTPLAQTPRTDGAASPGTASSVGDRLGHTDEATAVPAISIPQEPTHSRNHSSAWSQAPLDPAQTATPPPAAPSAKAVGPPDAGAYGGTSAAATSPGSGPSPYPGSPAASHHAKDPSREVLPSLLQGPDAWKPSEGLGSSSRDAGGGLYSGLTPGPVGSPADPPRPSFLSATTWRPPAEEPSSPAIENGVASTVAATVAPPPPSSSPAAAVGSASAPAVRSATWAALGSPSKVLAAPYSVGGYTQALAEAQQEPARQSSFLESYLDNLLRFDMPTSNPAGGAEANGLASSDGAGAGPETDGTAEDAVQEQQASATAGGTSALDDGHDEGGLHPERHTWRRRTSDNGRMPPNQAVRLGGGPLPPSSSSQFLVLQQHIEELTEEKLGLQRALAAQVKLYSSLEEENSALAERLNAQGQTVEALRAQVERYEAELTAQVLTVEGMAAEREAARVAQAEAMERAKALAGEVVGLESQLLASKSAALKQQQEGQRAAAQAAKLEKQLAAARKDAAAAAEDGGRLMTEKRALFVRLKQAEARLGRLMDEARLPPQAREALLAGMSGVKAEETDAGIQCDLLDGTTLGRLAAATDAADAAAAEAAAARQAAAAAEARAAEAEARAAAAAVASAASASPAATREGVHHQAMQQLAELPSDRMALAPDRDPPSALLAARTLSGLAPRPGSRRTEPLPGIRDLPPHLLGPVIELARWLPTGSATASNPGGAVVEEQVRLVTSIHNMLNGLEAQLSGALAQLAVTQAEAHGLRAQNDDLRRRLQLATQQLELAITAGGAGLVAGSTSALFSPSAKLLEPQGPDVATPASAQAGTPEPASDDSASPRAVARPAAGNAWQGSQLAGDGASVLPQAAGVTPPLPPAKGGEAGGGRALAELRAQSAPPHDAAADAGQQRNARGSGWLGFLFAGRQPKAGSKRVRTNELL